MTQQQPGAPAPGEPVRYRWVTGRRGPMFLPGNLIGKFLVEPVTGRRGITIASDGLTVHKLFGSRSIPWSEIREVTKETGGTQGQHLVVRLSTDEKVALPAPTAKTKDDVNVAYQQIESHLAAG